MAREKRKDRLIRFPFWMDEEILAKAEELTLNVNEAVNVAVEEWLDPAKRENGGLQEPSEGRRRRGRQAQGEERAAESGPDTPVVPSPDSAETEEQAEERARVEREHEAAVRAKAQELCPHPQVELWRDMVGNIKCGQCGAIVNPVTRAQ